MFLSLDLLFNTFWPRQNGRHFADDTLKRIFWNENVGISIKISPKFVHKGPINNIPALVQIMAWRRSGDKPLPEAMMVNLLTHICVSRPQWVKVRISCQLYLARCTLVNRCIVKNDQINCTINHSNSRWFMSEHYVWDATHDDVISNFLGETQVSRVVLLGNFSVSWISWIYN